MKKALLTGGSGFVGREFHRQLDDTWDIVNIDLANGDDCRDFFKHDPDKFDLVIHLAALVGGRRTIEYMPLAIAGDLSIDADFFQWIERAQPKHVIYFSSSAAYPVSAQKDGASRKLQEQLIDFSKVDTPDMTYGWAKLTGEYLSSFSSVPVHVLRPFSGYGTDQSPDYPFPSFIRRAQRREDPFSIWGDGTQVRDFIHISDVVAASLEAVNVDIREPVNLCTGRGTSFNMLQSLVCETAGYSPDVQHLLSEPTGVMHRVGDPSLMHSFYKPKISLEAGVARALKDQL